jgi:methanogenic corrinoid protein MtbC1
MNETARQLSITLDAVAGAVAEWTVSRHAEIDPALPERYGERWRREWVDDTRVRVLQLSQSIAVREPLLFVDAAAWARGAYKARSMPADDLDANLRSLRDVLESDVPEPVREPAVEYVTRAVDDGGMSSFEHGPRIGPNEPFGTEVLRYLEAVATGNRRDAEQIVLDLVDSGVSVQDVYTFILTPAQTEVGRMWHREEITIAEEHLATRATEGVMGALRARFARAQTNDRTVLTTTVGGDLHGVGVQMIADFFEMDGWRSLNLGANMPIRDLRQVLSAHDVDLLAISASSSMHVRSIGEVIDQLRRPPTEGVKVIVGGYPFNVAPELWRELGADGSAPSAVEAVALGNRIVAPR